MAELSTRSTYVLKPKRRRGRWLLLPALLLYAGILGWPIWVGLYEQRQLNQEMNLLRARGEPILLQDFTRASIPQAQNAALVLRAAASAMDTESETWKKYEWVELGLPLSDEEMQIIGSAIHENRQGLALLREARSRKAADWQTVLKRPMMEMLLPDLNPQKDLTNLALGDCLWQHQLGNDREAVERIRDLLAMSEAVDQTPHLVSHLVAIGIVAAGAEKLGFISPALRIGSSEGAVSRDEVRKLIDQLLDERLMHQGLKRGVRWERATNVDAIRSLQDGTTRSKKGEDDAMGRFVMKGVLLSDAWLVLERWSEIVAISLS